MKILKKLQYIYQAVNTQFIYYRGIKKKLKALQDGWRENSDYVADHNQKINKVLFEDFKSSSSLTRWLQTSDYEYGGSSQAKIVYNNANKWLGIGGKVDTINIGKLECVPYFGLIQKKPYDLRMGIMNALRVRICTDGQPVRCEMLVFSPYHGYLRAFAIILPDHPSQLSTYELPFRNFQLLESEIKSRAEVKDYEKYRMVDIIDKQNFHPEHLIIRSLAFRMNSTENTQKMLKFEKIEFVRTVRGTIANVREYSRPYFYLVDEDDEEDRKLDVIDLGQFRLHRHKTR